MATDIETFLFGQGGTHGVTEIGLASNRLTLTVAPWEGGLPATSVEFLESELLSIEVYADEQRGLSLPWDVIGFESYRLFHNRWRFVLHCSSIEYMFESLWPFRIEPH